MPRLVYTRRQDRRTDQGYGPTCSVLAKCSPLVALAVAVMEVGYLVATVEWKGFWQWPR